MSASLVLVSSSARMRPQTLRAPEGAPNARTRVPAKREETSVLASERYHMDFTIDDLNVLMEAMEAMENKDLAGDLMASVVHAMLTPKNQTPDADAQWQRDEEARKEKTAGAKAQRKERSILLRAKLIQMLDSARAGVLTSDLPHA